MKHENHDELVKIARENELLANAKENVRRAILDMAYRSTSRAGIEFDINELFRDLKLELASVIKDYNRNIQS